MTKWKLLQHTADWPAGTQFIRSGDGVWEERINDGAYRVLSPNQCKIMDGLAAKPKNWIEKIGDTQ